MKWILLGVLFFLNIFLYSAQETQEQQTQQQSTSQQQPQQEQRIIPQDPSSLKREYYRSLEFNTDYTVKLNSKIEENQLLSAKNFLVVTYERENKIKSIANYGNDRKLSLYVLDNRLNIFFYYLTFDYSGDLVKQITLRDINDQKLWEFRYEYDDKKNITKGEIWRREIVTGELKLLFYNEYKYYAQGKMFLHSVYNDRNELEEKTYYTPDGVKKRFERYSDGGKIVQYYIIHFYQNNNEIRREIYSASDVLLEIVEIEQPRTRS